MIRNAVLAGLALAVFAQPALALEVQKASGSAQPSVSSSSAPDLGQAEASGPAAKGKIRKPKDGAIGGRKRARAGEAAAGGENLNDTEPSLTLAAPTGGLDALISHHAKANGVPEDLVHRVIKRESRYNPRAVGRGGAMGLMQIKHGTARALGYAGSPSGLLSADTNLTYAVRYLAGAYKVANGDHNRAVAFYARGYYYDAKRRGMLGRLKKDQAPEKEIAAPAPERVRETASLSSRLFGNPVAAPYSDTPR